LNPLSLKLLVRKPGLHDIATQGHSIHFAINHRPTRGSISSYNISGLISEVFEEIDTQIAKNCSGRQPHSHLRPPTRLTPANVRIYALYFQKLESFAYIFVAGSMGVSLFKFVQLAPKNACCNRVRFGRSRSFKVIQGRWFWYQSKARIQLLISPSLWVWSYLAPFL